MENKEKENEKENEKEINDVLEEVSSKNGVHGLRVRMDENAKKPVFELRFSADRGTKGNGVWHEAEPEVVASIFPQWKRLVNAYGGKK